MKTVGIIAEYNPLHLGHKYLFDRVHESHDCVVCVLSGNFVQRGDVAVVSKYVRAEMALKSGADLVLELPVAWSMSTAQNFALGGISVLKNLSSVDTVAFGSECGDIELIKKAAVAAQSPDLKNILNEELKSGKTFAAARQKAIESLLFDEAELLSLPNNTLGAEYICAAKKLHFSPEFVTYKRLGAEHDDAFASDRFASAQYIRTLILSGKIDDTLDYLSNDIYNILKREYENGAIADINNIETAILAGLRMTKKDFFLKLPDLSEGIENRLFSFVKSSTSLDELYKLIKTRRYTMSRIRRTVLSAFLQIDNRFFGKQVPYIRVLGFTNTGEQFLKQASKTAKVPVITRAKDIQSLSKFSQDVFSVECKATDIFALSTASPISCGMEYTQKIIKV